MYEEAILRLYTLLGHEIKADMWSPTIVATVGSQKELAKMPKQQQLLERLSMLGRYGIEDCYILTSFCHVSYHILACSSLCHLSYSIYLTLTLKLTHQLTLARPSSLSTMCPLHSHPSLSLTPPPHLPSLGLG